MSPRSPKLVGMGQALLAYALWGALPLFWRQLSDIPALVVVAHRVVFSFLFLSLILLVRGRMPTLLDALRRGPNVGRTWGLSALAGILIAANWCIFIYAVSTGKVVSASLGYFINPLMSVALGMLFLGERLSRAAKVALAIALAGVFVLTLLSGAFPWIGVGLALLFGVYGLIKKYVQLGGAESLFVETGTVLIVALGYLAWQAKTGAAIVGTSEASIVWVVLTGVATAVPLMLFGAAARHVPLGTLGMLQYVAPIGQLLVGVVVLGEVFESDRLVGFGLIWVALMIYATDAFWSARRARRAQKGRSSPGLV